MTGDMLVFFILFAIIFIGGLFWFVLTDAKDLVRIKPIWRVFKKKKMAGNDAACVNDHKVAKLYREPPDEVESHGYLTIGEAGLAYSDPDGAEILRIPYGDIIECYLDEPRIGRRSMIRLAVSWASLPVPLMARVRYLNIRYSKNGIPTLLSFIYSDRSWGYLKGLVAEINKKIQK